MIDQVIDKIKEANFNNKQLEGLLVMTFQIAKPRADNLREVEAFASIIRQYSKLFPEDSTKIAELFGWEAAEKRVGKERKVIQRTDVFNKGDKRVGSEDIKKEPCDTCPDTQEIIDSYPKLNEVTEKPEEETFKLPGELYEDSTKEEQPTKLNEIKTISQLRIWFDEDNRPKKEIMDEMRSYMTSNQIEYDGTKRSYEDLLIEFFEKVIKGL